MTDCGVDTLQRLGRLDQGEFQRLGDLVLPQLYPDLSELVPHGVNDDDRTVKGVPDSYVGPSPDTCTIAVEYNTWSGQLKRKLKADYASVRESCPLARVLVLVSSALLDGADTADVKEQAGRDQIELRLVGGSTLARFLDERRQDLRHSFLNIAIDTHTRSSLIARFATAVRVQLREGPWERAQYNLIPRRDLDRIAMSRLSGDRPGVTVILGGMGAGKSIWAFAMAKRLAEGGPAALIRAKDLNFSADDPLSAMIAHLAHGATSGERIIALGDLLKRESLALNVIVDGVEEAPSYRAVERAIRLFRSSALAACSHLVLVVRHEAWTTLRPFLTAAWPEFEKASETGILRLNDLDTREIAHWLTREGAAAAEARMLAELLPEEFRGRPIFLLRGLELLRRGKLTREAPFAHALVDDYLESLLRGGAEAGPTVSRSRLRRCLGQLAWSCMVAATEELTRDQLERMEEAWEDDGEQGLLARCRQGGLLVARGPESVGFAHSLYQAAFAADHMREAMPEQWRRSIRNLPQAFRRARLVSLSPYLPSLVGLFDALMEIDHGLALECASHAPGALPPEHQAVVLDHLAVLLESRFPSDKRAGLRLLSSLRGAAAKALAVARFNALSKREREIWAPDWAEVFLRLEEPGALQIILRHWQLRTGGGFTWFEPDFVDSLGRLSQQFRSELADRAYRHVLDVGAPVTAAEILLAMLRDPRVVELLRSRLVERPLDHYEHRILVHLNTAEALELYTESAQKWIDRLVALRDQRGNEADTERSSALHTVVIKQTDIAMFPHDRLVDVVEACLSASLAETVWVGVEWAATLGHPALLMPWATSRATGWLFETGRTVEQVVQRGGAAVARPHMHRDAPRALRRALSRALRHCPGRDTEELLLEALGWDDTRDTAIPSIGQLRVVRAVPLLCGLLHTTDGWTLHTLIRVLGEIGHDSAVGPLVAWLRGQSPDRQRDHRVTVCVTLAAIGGEGAVEELAQLLPDVDNEKQIVATLLARSDPAGLGLTLQRLEDHRELLPRAVEVLGGMDLGRHLPQLEYRFDGLLRPHLRSPELCSVLLDATEQGLDYGGRWLTFDNPLRAAGRLDFPPALDWLRSVAERRIDWDAEDDQRRVDAPTCARQVLAELGVEPYLSQAVDRTLDEALARGQSFFSTHTLDPWPREVVRARIVDRIGGIGATRHLAWLLTRYAEPEDAALLVQLEASEDLDVADVVHQLVRWEGFIREGT